MNKSLYKQTTHLAVEAYVNRLINKSQYRQTTHLAVEAYVTVRGPDRGHHAVPGQRLVHADVELAGCEDGRVVVDVLHGDVQRQHAGPHLRPAVLGQDHHFVEVARLPVQLRVDDQVGHQAAVQVGRDHQAEHGGVLGHQVVVLDGVLSDVEVHGRSDVDALPGRVLRHRHRHGRLRKLRVVVVDVPDVDVNLHGNKVGAGALLDGDVDEEAAVGGEVAEGLAVHSGRRHQQPRPVAHGEEVAVGVGLGQHAVPATVKVGKTQHVSISVGGEVNTWGRRRHRL